MFVPGIGGPRVGDASVTAETTPHGPPSHSAIMAAHESNAIPAGPRITQAVRRTKVSHWKRPLFTETIVTRATAGPSGVSPGSTSDPVLLPGPPMRSGAPSGGPRQDQPTTSRATRSGRVPREGLQRGRRRPAFAALQ